MKWKTWKKKYCPICTNKLLCELGWKEQINSELKYFATGAEDSQDKLYAIKHNNPWRCKVVKLRHSENQQDDGVKDITCLVFARIANYRLKTDKIYLQGQINRLLRTMRETHSHIDDLKGVMRQLKGVKQ